MVHDIDENHNISCWIITEESQPCVRTVRYWDSNSYINADQRIFFTVALGVDKNYLDLIHTKRDDLKIYRPLQQERPQSLML